MIVYNNVDRSLSQQDIHMSVQYKSGFALTTLAQVYTYPRLV